MVSKDFVIRFVDDNKVIFDEVKPSFFEMTVAMAFVYFKQENVDFAVIEVGLGGRHQPAQRLYQLTAAKILPHDKRQLERMPKQRL